MPSGVADTETDKRYGPRCTPPDWMLPPPIYRARLNEIEGCHLEISCQCGNNAVTPISYHAKQNGLLPLGSLLTRFKCRLCKKPPTAILLNECSLKHFAYGNPRGWSVQVWPMMGAAPPL